MINDQVRTGHGMPAVTYTLCFLEAFCLGQHGHYIDIEWSFCLYVTFVYLTDTLVLALCCKIQYRKIINFLAYKILLIHLFHSR